MIHVILAVSPVWKKIKRKIDNNITYVETLIKEELY